MDGESSYESDISESWSLIDINLNEESVTTSEACSSIEPEESSLSRTQIINFKKLNSLILDKGEKETASGSLRDSDSDLSLNSQKSASGKEKLKSQEDISLEELKNDSGDDDSIEILDVDESYRDTDIKRLQSLDFSEIADIDYESGDYSEEEYFYKKNDDKTIENSFMAVIKRKRRKQSNVSQSSKDSVNSDLMYSSEKYYLKVTPYDLKKCGEDRQLEPYRANRQPVYKHYRNNVTNAMLSLSVSFIFAGVACIAIGHFLGVHDVEETTGELMETLKKLQMENVALQSRLTHVNRACHTREMNTKLKQSNEVQEKDCSDRKPASESIKVEEIKINHISEPGVHSSLNSVEWLSWFQNLVRGKEFVNNENFLDLGKVMNYIHDQLTFLNPGKKEDTVIKHLESTNAKISKILQNIIVKLSSSHDNIENLYGKLVVLKDKLNKKLNQIFPNHPKESSHEEGENFGQGREKSLPAVEQDLYSIQWSSNRKSKKLRDLKKESAEIDKSIALPYKFPQPKEYYYNCKNNSQTKENHTRNSNKQLEAINTNEPYNKSICHSEEIELNRTLIETEQETKLRQKRERKNEKKLKKENRNEKTKSKEYDKKKGKNGKSRKEKSVKGKDYRKRMVKEARTKSVRGKKTDGIGEKRQKQIKNYLKANRQSFNGTIYQKKKYLKMDKEDLNKLRIKAVRKKFKNSKLRKVLARKFVKKLNKLKEGKPSRLCSRVTAFNSKKYDMRCFNQTGYWVFKWADGREQLRKQRKLGEWQFERAKGRKELRSEDINLNWQFRRALARENDRWYQEKYRSRNLNGDRFYHDGFSWV